MTLYVVTGPPASGKSTWVQERAQPGDIVIDFDLLALALTGPGAAHHGHRDPLAKVTFQARRAAIREALKYASSHEVFVIHATPKSADAALYTEHGAETVVIDPGRDVVLERCSRMRPSDSVEGVNRWYRHLESVNSIDRESEAISQKSVDGASWRW